MDYSKNSSPHTLDDLLRETMTISPSAVAEQNQLILAAIPFTTPTLAPQNAPRENVFSALWKRLRILAPVPVLCIIFVLFCTVTVYAAGRFLSASESAEKMNYHVLAEAFQHEDALEINETQSSGGFDITLLGITFGSAIQEVLDDSSYEADQAYVIVAFSYSDGTPFPHHSEERWLEEIPDFYMTFLANGYSIMDNPLDRASSLSGWYQDGVYYQLSQCQNLSQYADTGIYFAVNDGIRCSGFTYDESTDTIRIQEVSDGIHALFSVSLNDSVFESPFAATDSPLQNTSAALSTDVLSTDASVSEADTSENIEINTASDSSHWTEEQLQLLNQLSVPGAVQYVTADKILVLETAPHGSHAESRFTLYDYSGQTLDTLSVVLEDLAGSPSEPVCTADGFVVYTGSQVCVYDYDFTLRYSCDLEDIPSQYPAMPMEVHTDGERSVITAYYDFSGGYFSANLDYYACLVDVDVDNRRVTEGWLYNSLTQEWTMLYHDALPYSDFDYFDISTLTPSEDGKYALYTCLYIEEQQEGVPNESLHGYGVLSLETGQILSFYEGSASAITPAQNGIYLLYLSNLHNETTHYVIMDLTTMTQTIIDPDINSEDCFGRISPDGHQLLIYEEEWDPHLYHCQIYDVEKDTFSEKFDLALNEGKRARFQAFPGGFLMKRWDDSQRIFFSYDVTE